MEYPSEWGYLAFNRVSDSNRTKLDPTAMMSVFAGYTGNTKKYTPLDSDSNDCRIKGCRIYGK